MTDDQLRALVRDSVARHLAAMGAGTPAGLAPPPPAWAQPATAPSEPATMTSGVTAAQGAVTIASAPGGIAIAAAPGSVVHLHVSHATFSLPTALDGSSDGPCMTEPHSGCTGCGFCQSLGY